MSTTPTATHLTADGHATSFSSTVPATDGALSTRQLDPSQRSTKPPLGLPEGNEPTATHARDDTHETADNCPSDTIGVGTGRTDPTDPSADPTPQYSVPSINPNDTTTGAASTTRHLLRRRNARRHPDPRPTRIVVNVNLYPRARENNPPHPINRPPNLDNSQPPQQQTRA
jgi:hypothetical protein